MVRFGSASAQDTPCRTPPCNRSDAAADHAGRGPMQDPDTAKKVSRVVNCADFFGVMSLITR